MHVYAWEEKARDSLKNWSWRLALRSLSHKNLSNRLLLHLQYPFLLPKLGQGFQNISPALFHGDQRRHSRYWLGHGGQAENRIIGHRDLFIPILIASGNVTDGLWVTLGEYEQILLLEI